MLVLDPSYFPGHLVDDLEDGLATRPIKAVEQEVRMADRHALDSVVFDILELSQDERDAVYDAVVHLVSARLVKAASLAQ